MVVAEQSDVPPSRWLSVWARDQVFWRDVASRTLSGLLVVSVTAVAATVAGFLAVSPGDLAAFLGVLALVAVAVWWLEGPKHGPVWWRVLVGIVVAIALGLVLGSTLPSKA